MYASMYVGMHVAYARMHVLCMYALFMYVCNINTKQMAYFQCTVYSAYMSKLQIEHTGTGLDFCGITL